MPLGQVLLVLSIDGAAGLLARSIEGLVVGRGALQLLLGCGGRVGGVGLASDIAAVHGGSRHGGVSASERRAAMSSEAEWDSRFR